ncbi:hypothetical protein J4416_01730 [Candidatus Pacearchaeota archaeon]|nr:hypothetical protein [Candidatus Pacearchaeota archaeon]
MVVVRKGMLTDNMLGMVLAIIGLVILGFLGVKLYSMFVSQDLKNAQAFVEDLSAKIENLKDGESNTFALRGVTEWVLVGYSSTDKSRPDKCFLNSCLCLCKYNSGESPSFNCQDNGYCRAVDRDIVVSSEIVSSGTASTIYDVRDYIVCGVSVSCYIMHEDSLLIPFDVSKQKSDISIKATALYEPSIRPQG